MRCPSCGNPMHQGRHEPGQYKVFHCERCKRQRTRRDAERTGYEGSIVINSKVPIRHQE